MVSRARVSAVVTALVVFTTAGLAGVVPAAFAAAPTVAPVTVAPGTDEVVTTTPVFSWQPVAGAAMYRFQASQSSAFPASSPAPLYDVTTYGTHATPPSPLPLGQAYWHVAALDATGSPGPFSPVVPFVVGSVAAPAQTAPADASTLTYPSQPPVLRWQPVPGVKSYNVDIDDNPDFTSPQSFTQIPTSQLALTEPPALDIPQYWRVQGVLSSAGVTTSWSTPWSFTSSWPDLPVPTAPTNGATVPEVRLAWNPVAGARTYEVQVSPNGDFQNNLLQLAGATAVAGTEYAPTTELQPRSYYWRVRAKDDSSTGQLGQWGATATFTLALLDAPGGLTPGLDVTQAGTPPQVPHPTFSWAGVARAARYEVQLGSDQNFSTGTFASCTTDHTTLTPFLSGVKYPCNPSLGTGRLFWRVRGVSSQSFNGQWSPVMSFYGSDGSVPNVTAPANGASFTGVPVITWDPYPGVNKYRVTYQKSGTAYSITRDVYSTSFTPQGSGSGYDGTYTYTVQTLDANNALGPLMPTRSYTVTSPASGPSLTAVAPNGSQTVDMPSMSWTPLTGATYYQVLYQAVGAPTWLTLSTERLYVTAYTPTAEPLTAGAYSWMVQAYDGNNNVIAASNALPFTILETDQATYTGPPSCLTTACASLSDVPTLSWNPVPYAHHYVVHVATDSAFANPLPDHATQDTRITFPEQLADNQAGQSYYWYVQVCKSAGVCGPYQDSNLAGREQSFRKRTPGVLLVSPAAGATVGDDPHFAWQRYSDTDPTASPAKQYHLQVSSDSGFNTLVDNETLDQTTFTSFAKEYPDGTYYWRVQAIDAEGQPLTYSDPRTFVKSSLVPSLDPVGTSTPLPTLTWQPLGYVGGYRLEVYPGLTTNVAPVVQVTNKLPAWTPATALDKGTYTWRVAKVDASGNRGPWSATSTFDVTLPLPVLGSPSDGAQLTTNDLLFSWSLSSSSVAAYRFESSTSTAFTTVFESQQLTGTTWATTRKYADGTTYYWRVSALDGAGHVLATSAPWSFVKDTVPPTVVSVTPTSEVPLAGPLTVTFSEPVTGVSTTTLKVYPKFSPSLVVPGVLTVAADSLSASFRPSGLLTPGAVYTVGLTTGIQDAGGNPLPPATYDRRAATVVDSSSPALTELWDGDTSSYASGGTYATSRLAGATATFAFTGTSTSLLATKTPLGGYGTVQLDSRTPVTVSFFRSSTAYRQVVWSASGLTSGVHTVRVRVLGTKPTGSSSTYVYVDAFTNGPSVVQETAASVRQGFSRVAASSAFGGSYDRELVDPAGDTGGKPEYRLTFQGTAVSLYAVRSTASGRARVIVDGVARGDVDLYATATYYNTRVFGLSGLPAGTHSVRLVLLGTKSTSSSGYFVQLDRAVVG